MEELCEIRTNTNIMGVPLSFTRNGHREKVAAIYEHRRVPNEPGRNSPEWDYFKIKTSKGLMCDIYRDTTAKRWYLGKTLER